MCSNCRMVSQGLPVRGGVALLDVLVAAMVATLFLAIAVPALRGAREASHLTHCTDNFRQIGVAIQSYHTTWKRFPSAWGGGKKNSPHLLQAVLPWLAEAEMGVFPQPPIGGLVDEGEYRLPMLGHCPASGDTSPLSVNCKVNAGTGKFEANGFCCREPIEPTDPNGKWILPDGPWTSVEEITDGLAETAACSEALRPLNSPQRTPAKRAVFLIEVEEDDPLPTVAQIRNRCLELDVTQAELEPRGYLALDFYNHLMPPNSHSCNVGGAVLAPEASSNHDQGVNVLFVDGHVKFISDSIDRVTWGSLGTRAKRDPVRDF